MLGGRLPHLPSEESRNIVKDLASTGVQQNNIAIQLGLSEKTLRKHYRKELDYGLSVAITKVTQSLFQTAIGNGPGHMAAKIFFLKTRAGWKERSEPEEREPTLSELMSGWPDDSDG